MYILFNPFYEKNIYLLNYLFYVKLLYVNNQLFVYLYLFDAVVNGEY